jgi:lysophospholipase L1-like esterase
LAKVGGAATVTSVTCRSASLARLLAAAVAAALCGCSGASAGVGSSTPDGSTPGRSNADAAIDGPSMTGSDDGPDLALEAAAGADTGAGLGAGRGLDAAADADAYDPCPPAGTPCRIMPLGDSITYGYSSSDLGGYREPMFTSAVNAGHSITFVGSQTSGPTMVDGMPFPQENEGHSGYTIDDGGGRTGIQGLVQNALQTYHPHIVTLMIGTNDVDIQLDLANAPTRLGKLLDTILAADPNLLLVVAQITPTQDDTENMLVQAYNAAIPALVSARANSGKHIVIVDMYGAIVANAAYKTALLANSLHPTDAGFVTIAGVWDAAIARFFR